MFFSKKKRLQRMKDELALREFRISVTNLMNGIKKLDDCVQKIIKNKDMSHNTALFVMRNTEDLLSVVSIYKHTKYYHEYLDPSINKSMTMLKDMMFDQESNARKLAMLIENFETTKKNAEKGFEANIVDAGDLHKINERLYTANLMIEQLIFQMKMNYRDYRAALAMLRGIVANDHIAILSGIDIPLLYEDYETLVHNHCAKRDILFDAEEIEKILASKQKEEITHE